MERMSSKVGAASPTYYDDCGHVIELMAVYDDHLKRDSTFTDYAVMVAQKIANSLHVNVKVEYGKWGARIVPANNPHLSEEQIRTLCYRIINHPSWTGLCLSTWTFTYDEDLEDKLADELAASQGHGASPT